MTEVQVQLLRSLRFWQEPTEWRVHFLETVREQEM